MKTTIRLTALCCVMAALACSTHTVQAHHSAAGFAMGEIKVMTGVVERVYPGASHMEIFFKPMNAERIDYQRDADGKPVLWSVELAGAAAAANEGISVNSFPPNTIFSIGLHPKRDGKPAGLRVRNAAVYRCPERKRPAPGLHCDAVEGHVAAGIGMLPEGD